MSQEKVEYITVSKLADETAVVEIGEAVKITADYAVIDPAEDLKLYKDNTVVACIETYKPAEPVPNAVRRAIEYNETFHWEA